MTRESENESENEREREEGGETRLQYENPEDVYQKETEKQIRQKSLRGWENANNEEWKSDVNGVRKGIAKRTKVNRMNENTSIHIYNTHTHTNAFAHTHCDPHPLSLYHMHAKNKMKWEGTVK